MPGFAARLHLPYAQWPAEDRRFWEEAIGDGDDPFATAAGAYLASATQKRYLFGWRRWLGFLALDEPTVLEFAPAERVTLDHVRRFAAHLAETNRPQSVAVQVDALYKAARVMVPERDWTWLKDIKARLYAVPPIVRAAKPVITSLQLLDLGIELMDENAAAVGCIRPVARRGRVPGRPDDRATGVHAEAAQERGGAYQRHDQAASGAVRRSAVDAASGRRCST